MSALVVAIEGIDGSGKGTQAGRLRDALTADGFSCGLIAFPRYEATTFGRTIARYLNGEFGDLHAAGPQFASLLYAGDRFESLPLIESERSSRDILIFDRYVPSNLAHQAAKLPASTREPFIQWVESIEYGVYRLPRPDLILYLDMPVEIAQRLVARKPTRGYTSKSADLHEADAAYLEATAGVYRELAGRDPTWRVIECSEAGEPRPADTLEREIAAAVRDRLRLR